MGKESEEILDDAAEIQYRRGFLHGAQYVLTVLEGDEMPEGIKVHNWINGPLRDWRYRGPQGKIEQPPDFGS